MSPSATHGLDVQRHARLVAEQEAAAARDGSGSRASVNGRRGSGAAP